MRQTWPAEQSLARVTRHRVESTYGDHLKEMSLGSSQYPSTIYVGYRPGSFKSRTYMYSPDLFPVLKLVKLRFQTLRLIIQSIWLAWRPP